MQYLPIIITVRVKVCNILVIRKKNYNRSTILLQISEVVIMLAYISVITILNVNTEFLCEH